MSSYQDPRWQKKRLEIMSRDNFICVACGAKDKTLHVHHKKYVGEVWESPDSHLQTLCEDCHKLLGEHPKGGIYWGLAFMPNKYPDLITEQMAIIFLHCPNCGEDSLNEWHECKFCQYRHERTKIKMVSEKHRIRDECRDGKSVFDFIENSDCVESVLIGLFRLREKIAIIEAEMEKKKASGHLL